MSNILKYKTFSGNVIEGNLWIEMFKTADQYQDDGWWCVPLSEEAWNLWSPLDPETEEHAGFSYNKDITDIILPTVITRIGSYTFEGCSKLISLNIPESVTEVGEQILVDSGWENQRPEKTFMYLDNWCVGYKSMSGRYQPSGDIVVPDGTIGLCEGCMQYYSDVTSVHLPDSLLYIGTSAFTNCGTLDLNIPPNLVSIGWGAFNATTFSLPDNTFVVPETLTYIGSYNFQNKGISTVVCYSKVPPTLESNNFNGNDDTLYVYESALEAYQNSQWGSQFTNIITIPDPEPPVPPTPHCGFNLSGMKDTSYVREANY